VSIEFDAGSFWESPKLLRKLRRPTELPDIADYDEDKVERGVRQIVTTLRKQIDRDISWFERMRGNPDVHDVDEKIEAYRRVKARLLREDDHNDVDPVGTPRPDTDA